MIGRETTLHVVWMFWVAAWFTMTGWYWADNQYGVALAQAVVGVALSFVYIRDRHNTHAQLGRLQQMKDRVFSFTEYELRRENGSRVVVGYLQGDRDG